MLYSHLSVYYGLTRTRDFFVPILPLTVYPFRDGTALVPPSEIETGMKARLFFFLLCTVLFTYITCKFIFKPKDRKSKDLPLLPKPLSSLRSLSLFALARYVLSMSFLYLSDLGTG